jgi:hypothetical protein
MKIALAALIRVAWLAVSLGAGAGPMRIVANFPAAARIGRYI